MTDCFVASFPDRELVAVYEYDGKRLSFINNRSFGIEVADEQTAEMEVQKHSSLFAQNKFPLIDRLSLSVGTYIRSIARPIFTKQRLVNLEFDTEREFAARARREVGLLSHDLEECFDVSSPDALNFSVFGTTYESIILFACIGVENLFAKILRDNDVSHSRGMYTTTDFVKLHKHMRLSEYTATLPRYPWLPTFAPFRTWTTTEPTRSLPWYHAYNKLKHDKSASYHQATMENAINASLAYWILLQAVFGSQFEQNAFSSGDENFVILDFPKWDLQQNYFEAENGLWSATALSF